MSRDPVPGGTPHAVEDVGGRAVPYACPFCGEEDLRPVEQGRWHCRGCLRVFAVQFFGLLQPSAGAPPAQPHHDPGSTRS